MSDDEMFGNQEDNYNVEDENVLHDISGFITTKEDSDVSDDDFFGEEDFFGKDNDLFNEGITAFSKIDPPSENRMNTFL